MGIHMFNDDATCVNNPGSYDCRCVPGFTGTGFGQGFPEDSQTYTTGPNTTTEITFRGCKDIDDCDSDLYEGPALSPNGPCVKGLCTADLGPDAFNCLCDAGYRGPSCEFQECPSGTDPLDGYGNEAGRDCSGRGLCNFNEGTCPCFSGFFGTRCQYQTTIF